MKKKLSRILLVFSTLMLISCGITSKEVASFPPSDEVFITSGDGDIQKPYTPVGQLIFYKVGYRIPLPLLGLIPINDVRADRELREQVITEVKKRGGDGLINMSINFTSPKSGFLGFGANGGYIFVTGTIIKR